MQKSLHTELLLHKNKSPIPMTDIDIEDKLYKNPLHRSILSHTFLYELVLTAQGKLMNEFICLKYLLTQKKIQIPVP